MPPSPKNNVRDVTPDVWFIVKSTDVLNVSERALKLLGDDPKFKEVLGRVLPANTRSVVVRLDANGVEEKLSDANVALFVNQLLSDPAPVHV